MARWEDVEASEPEFAARARGFFEAGKHKTLATLRADGSPRISGSEADFVLGDLWFGGMWESRKALDLRRDPRFALHSPSEDPPGWKGDAKVAGRVEEIEDPDAKQRLLDAQGNGPHEGPFHLFRAEVEEVVVVRLGEPADHLLIELWRPGRELVRMKR